MSAGSDSELRQTLILLSLLSRNPVSWFERLPLRELDDWAEALGGALKVMREEG